MSTLLVLHFLLDLLNKSRTDAKALTMRNYFKDVGMLVTQEASRHNDVLKFSVGDFPMHVLPTGKLQGFRSWLTGGSIVAYTVEVDGQGRQWATSDRRHFQQR